MVFLTDLKALTGSDGKFVIDRVPQGSYALRVLHVGYQVKDTVGVHIGAGETLDLEFVLAPIAPRPGDSF